VPISEYLRALRTKVGTDLLLVPSVTVIARDEQGRVLLVRHADTGHWVAPGGSIDPGERPREAALREMREETGLEVELDAIVGVFGGPEFEVRYENGDRCAYVMAVYEARVTGGTPRPDGEETVAFRWVPESEWPHLDVPPWMRVVMPEVFAVRLG
jgi:ADP-ribose pyrophosphatase YjhB (NUDIX family)